MSLRDLIGAVEAGTLCQGEFISQADGDLIDACFPLLDDDIGPWEYFALAMDGSLDAAKALHDAQLPGWRWKITCGELTCYVAVFPPTMEAGNRHTATHDNPARAWLLAILRAMEAEGRDTGGKDG